MVAALDRKLLRDLWELRTQALAIALVVAGGVATLIMSLSTVDSLETTRATYYRDYRFAEAFASLKRAPESIASRLRAIPGVRAADTRVTAAANVDIAGFDDPVKAQVLSVPAGRQPPINRLYLRRGGLPSGRRDNEVVLSEPFAEAHGFDLGDRLTVTIRGSRRQLTVVGIALSPEYIYQIQPGAVFPDFARYGVLWMARRPLAAANDMEGAFNDAAFMLERGVSPAAVLDRVDAVLERYGGQGAYLRDDQLSHRYLEQELEGLRAMAGVFPVIFLGVAAFLLNVIITRLTQSQRQQVALLKAFGYGNAAVGWHYAKLALAVVGIGIAIGTGGGIWLGRAMSEVYMMFFRFPFLIYSLQPWVVALGAGVSIASALVGSWRAVRSVVSLAPAAAMQPAAPTRYRPTLLERLGLQRWLSQPTRMIARHIERNAVKSLLTVAGIGFAVGILMIGRFQQDAVDFMVRMQFGLAQRNDLRVAFVEPTSYRAVHELASLPGVGYAEPYRVVPVRLRNGNREYRTGLEGLPERGELRRVLNVDLQPLELPAEGLVLTEFLAETLDVTVGETLTVEALEGRRPVRQVPVTGLIREYMGVSAYMRLPQLNRLMREGHAISGAYLTVDASERGRIYDELDRRPRVAGVTVREVAIRNFYDTMADTILYFTAVATLLAATIAFGVVYNSARIALAERERELASLRILGFTRGEIAYILLGELAVLTLAAIPVGFLIGRGLSAYLAAELESDLYRIPLVVEPDTYAFAATVVLGSAVLCAWLVRRRIQRLDLVAVLKTRE